MWRARSHGAVFVPRSPEGSRVAYSLKRLHAAATVRVLARVQLEPVAPISDGVASMRCSGSLQLRGPQASILFRPSADTVPSRAAVITTDSPCTPESPRVAVPERILRARCDPRPYAWVDFQDGTGRSLAGALCVGRVEHKPVSGERDFVVPASMTVWVAAREVNRRRGPVVDLSGELTFPNGIELRIRLGSDCGLHGEPSGQVEIARVPVLPPGVTVPITRCEMTPGAPGNPEVSVLLRDFSGMEAGDEMAIGRCVQLD